MAACLSPFTLRDPEGQQVVCGKCYNCVMRRVSAWSFRLMQEELRSSSALFLTLTYGNKDCPYSSTGMTLKPEHTQLYMKRLRKAHGTLKYIRKAWCEGGSMLKPIKYFTVGEYGSRHWRPHYHQIIFNADIALIQDAWQYGSVYYGKVEGASIGYCLKYISKAHRIPLYDGDKRVPEFAWMSKRLGDNYITENMVAWHHADLENRMYVNIDGKKVSMCRYYKDKIYTPEQRDMIGYASYKLGQEKLIELQEEYIKKYGIDWQRKWEEYRIYMKQKLKVFGSKDKRF